MKDEQISWNEDLLEDSNRIFQLIIDNIEQIFKLMNCFIYQNGNRKIFYLILISLEKKIVS